MSVSALLKPFWWVVLVKKYILCWKCFCTLNWLCNIKIFPYLLKLSLLWLIFFSAYVFPFLLQCLLGIIHNPILDYKRQKKTRTFFCSYLWIRNLECLIASFAQTEAALLQQEQIHSKLKSHSLVAENQISGKPHKIWNKDL